MAKGTPIIELKHHANFNLIEPGYIRDMQKNLRSYAGVYYDLINVLYGAISDAEGQWTLKGKDVLTQRLNDLKNSLDKVIDITDYFPNMRLYDKAKEERKKILNNKRKEIETEKNDAQVTCNKAQKELEPITSLISLQWGKGSELISKRDKAKIVINHCNEDLEIINRLDGGDYNEY